MLHRWSGALATAALGTRRARLGVWGIVIVVISGCVTAQSVATRLREDQIEAATARVTAEWGESRGDGSGAAAAAATALGASRDAHAWVDAYVIAHGEKDSARFAPLLQMISEDVEAARAAAVRAGATMQSIEAAATRQPVRAQAGGGGGGGGGGGM